MEPVQTTTENNYNNNGEVSSTTYNQECYAGNTTIDPLTKYRRIYKTKQHTENAASDNEGEITHNKAKLQTRNFYKSMNNINDYKYQDENNSNITNRSNILSSHQSKKFETLQIPIVGYEVMEERARFTIYKLKVEDDKSDQSWLVFRRYTDFVRLYSRIKTEVPNVILPLPGKRWFRDNFDPIFLEERVRGLQVFVNAILKTLPNHPIVREFFCLDEPPQVLTYQPEVQAVYGALEESISSLKLQVAQKDATIKHLQNKVRQLETQMKSCTNCSTNNNLQPGQTV